jgi:murein L,D-transpeptidase YcbB/YkuD
MLRKVNLANVFLFALIVGCCFSCRQKHAAEEKAIVQTPEEMDAKVADNIKAVLTFAKSNDGKINDSITLSLYDIVTSFYQQEDFKGIWSSKEKWMPLADSMFSFIKNARYYGLYPEDYHYSELDMLRNRIGSDSMIRKDAISWTKADLMLSDAFMRTLKDLKEGRLVADSVSAILKNKYVDSFFVRHLKNGSQTGTVVSIFNNVEPTNINYQTLRNALKTFVDSMDTKKYLYLNFPYKDSLAFVESLRKRLSQSGFGEANHKSIDSGYMVGEIKKYQAKHGLTVDGKAGPKMIKTLNNNDNEKFKKIAITLDRYKLLPALPEAYIWVNLPGFYLKLWNQDTVVLESKVIVGKPETRTPLLTSAISDMVTYPQWTIPESIIKKDILPALKKDPGYLQKKGFSLVSNKGETVDPYTVDWSKYKTGIPWNVVQGSGDDNALGVFKFNFNNPYSVYLHDTNQRYLFQNSERALSHGCVRVQKWQALAYFIATGDSIASADQGKTVSYDVDSIKTWIANKSRKRIMVKKRLPLYIEYFTCDTRNNKVVFYDDIYNEDRQLAQKYFSGK